MSMPQAPIRTTVTSPETAMAPGLSTREAATRLQADGYNELPSARPRSTLAIAWEVIREPMLLLLLAAGTIYLFLGDLGEALLLLASIGVVIAITLFQEQKTERALDALKDLSSPRALVVRDGQQLRIPGREVVRGDLVMLAEGDRVPADGVVQSSSSLSADESLLTGESVPVRKVAGSSDTPMERAGGEDSPCVYSGTLIVKGRGLVEIRAIGASTEMGRIGKSLQSQFVEETSIQQETGRIVRLLAVAGLSLCLLVALIYGTQRGDVLAGLLAGVTLAMSLVPEEFPIVLVVFLALGAWRLAQSKVLTRRMPALETLGAATILAVDKTGTLTQNQMTVQRVVVRGNRFDIVEAGNLNLSSDAQAVVAFSALASHPDPFDPMEKALHDVRSRLDSSEYPVTSAWILARDYPLSPALLAVVHVWQMPNSSLRVVATKGAPEAIAELCRLGVEDTTSLMEQVQEMAVDGLRVLGVARGSAGEGDLPEDPHGFRFELLGLIGLADPVRAAVPSSVNECYKAGIRVVMITGDYPATAQSIARQIGLDRPELVITGPDLEEMDDHDLEQRLKTTNIFARVVPEHKLRLVNVLKASGEVVAMTGDGVNDAPALKSANIGVAMGGRGTDVAREAAAIVVLDDDFSSIVAAVRIGRRIYDNLKKAMGFVLAMHVPIAGMSLVPVIFGLPLVLLPVHIVFLEMIIDPSCSLVFEAEREETNVMDRPPRPPRTPLFSRRLTVVSMLQGGSVFAVVLVVYAISLALGQTEGETRALTFTTLVVATLALILTNRSWSRSILSTSHDRNPILGTVVAGTVLFLGLVLFVPYLRDLFRFGVLHPDDLVAASAAGIFSILWFEVLKVTQGRHVHE